MKLGYQSITNMVQNILCILRC